MWRVAKGLQKQISYNFLLTGHTKFSPDRYFGVFKSKYAVSNIDIFNDLMQCVTDSSPSGCNKPVSAENLVWYDWVSYLKKVYKPLVGITSFHHFVISSDGIEAKQFADSVETTKFQLVLKAVNDFMPKITTPQGLSLQRQWYLFKNIRDLVFDAKKADNVAPKPKEMLANKTTKDKNPDKIGLESNNKTTKQKKESTKLVKLQTEKSKTATTLPKKNKEKSLVTVTKK